MSFSISQELQRTFHLASLHREASHSLTGQDWHEYQQLKNAYARQRRTEERAYGQEYKTRVEIARKRLTNQAGEKNKDFKRRWFGHDNSDANAINRQARRQVEMHHKRLMAHLDMRETRDIETLLQRASRRQTLREKPKRDFERAADRRTAMDRRKMRSRARRR